MFKTEALSELWLQLLLLAYGVRVGVAQAHDSSVPTLTDWLKALCTPGQSVILDVFAFSEL